MRSQELHDRFSRIVPQRTRDFTVLIAGAGMVGSWTALALARMVKKVDIWDFDTVDAANVGVQAYSQGNLGEFKTTALERHSYGLPLEGHCDRFPREIPTCDILVMAVDSIPGRRQIAEDAYDQGVGYIIDTRVLGEIACIHAVDNTQGDSDHDLIQYIIDLPKGDDLVSAPCGAKGTAYAGMWVASRVCGIVNHIGRGLPLPSKEVWHVGMNCSVAPEVRQD